MIADAIKRTGGHFGEAVTRAVQDSGDRLDFVVLTNMVLHIIATIVFGGFGIVLLVVGINNLSQQRRFLVDPQRVEAVITYPDKAFLIAEASAGPMIFIVLGLLIGPIVWIVGKWIF